MDLLGGYDIVLRMHRVFLYLGCLFLFFGCDEPEKGWHLSADFPGGNIVIDSIVDNQVYVRPDQKGTDTAKGEWFYWQFKVENAQGKALEFVFNQDHAITKNGPAYSRDQGENWHFLYPDTLVDTNAFSFQFGRQDSAVLFCMTIPYVQSDWERFIESAMSDGEYIERSFLAETNKGRKISYYRIKNPDQELERTLFFTSRHHACESTANFVLEGVIEAFLGKLQTGDSLVQGIQLIVIPFMDLDGVQLGEQGKNRPPHDHNRDYLQFFYPTTRAVDSIFTRITQGTKTINIDLHSPWIKFNQNETLFFIGQEKEAFAQRTKQLAMLIDSLYQGVLPFKSEKDVFSFGKDWNNRTMEESFEDQLFSFSQWGALQDNVCLATTLEVPYSNVRGEVLSKDNLRAFGVSLLNSLLVFHPSPK